MDTLKFAAALTLGGRSASCKASLSTMSRILKPYRRSMGYDRKANCIILAHEHELANNEKTKDLIRDSCLARGN